MDLMSFRPAWLRPAVLLAALLLLAACAPGTAAGSDTGAGTDDRLAVAASFYPLQFVAQRVGGEHVRVRSLTKPGVEPHDLELTPRDVAALSRSDAVLFLKGFQPAVDQAVAADGPPLVVDAAPTARLDLHYTPLEDGLPQRRAAGSTDPHFWLDPTRLAAVAATFAAELQRTDPGHAAAYRANLAALTRDLGALDRQLRTGLSRCAGTELVTSHTAFGYLAARYGMHQVGIVGLSPDAEPDPGQLARADAFVREHHVRTIYYETLVSPAVARTVAAETGARVSVLDPLEGLDDSSAGSDYLEVMRSNLEALRQGQPCA
jgi:zinc transport system substrate-binding protein